jgi:hypothetical protein
MIDINKKYRLHIADLKFGKGVRVDAEHNPQAMLYALGAYNMFQFDCDIERIYATDGCDNNVHAAYKHPDRDGFALLGIQTVTDIMPD